MQTLQSLDAAFTLIRKNREIELWLSVSIPALFERKYEIAVN
jgi:hypothetical protein